MNTPTPSKSKIESAYKEMMEDVQMSGSMIAYCMKDKALELETELTAAREELAESKQQINIRRSNNLRLDRITREQQELIENLKKLSGARESDCIAMREMATKIQSVTEQRDRLVEALEQILNYQGRFAEEDPESIATEALQSLNQNEPNPAAGSTLKENE